MKINYGSVSIIGGTIYILGNNTGFVINGLITQSDDYLITQSGDYLIWG
jgi:hypothetical protein